MSTPAMIEKILTKAFYYGVDAIVAAIAQEQQPAAFDTLATRFRFRATFVRKALIRKKKLGR